MNQEVGKWFSPVLGAAALALLVCTPGCHAQGAAPDDAAAYSGMCDASAAVPLGAGTFIVADNEINTLFVYRRDRAGPPVRTFPWDARLGIGPNKKGEIEQADIEGATRVGDRIYWITSHGRNKNGKWRKQRQRFFATDVRVKDGEAGEMAVEPFGRPYENLMVDLVRDPVAEGLGLAEAFGLGTERDEELAPKRRGLNIEGLAATPDGKSLLIGFRNPLVRGKALIVPLNNPAAVLAEGSRPEFGKPILLDLPGRTKKKGKPVALGIRSIEYSKRHGAYFIAGGPSGTQDVCALYRWSGDPAAAPRLLPKATAAVAALDDFAPEAIVVYPDKDKLQLLSDDGSRMVAVGGPGECKQGAYESGRCEAKSLLDDRRKTFRSLWVDAE